MLPTFHVGPGHREWIGHVATSDDVPYWGYFRWRWTAYLRCVWWWALTVIWQ